MIKLCEVDVGINPLHAQCLTPRHDDKLRINLARDCSLDAGDNFIGLKRLFTL